MESSRNNPDFLRDWGKVVLRDNSQDMELRKRHNIEVPEADYPQLASLDSCAEYLTPKFEALGK